MTNHRQRSSAALLLIEAHTKIIRKMGNSTRCKIVTLENFIVKLCTRDYLREITLPANFGFNWYSGGFSPKCLNRWNVTTSWLFWLSCPVCPYLFSWSCTQIRLRDWFSRLVAYRTCFHVRMVLLGVRRMGDVIWGNTSPTSPLPPKKKLAWIPISSQNKVWKYKNRNPI